MFIAQELRKKNIAEYLLYMWHIEDLIRAYKYSLTNIRSQYINKFDYTTEQKEEMTDWYGDLLTMMNHEGKRAKGHLQINEIIMQELCELHSKLLQSSKYPFYNAEYYKVLPYIVELHSRGNKDLHEIEICLNALYGVMLLHIQDKEISPETEHAIKEITTFIGMLSDYYIKDERESLDF
jgi:hypothetical protein